MINVLPHTDISFFQHGGHLWLLQATGQWGEALVE